MAKEINIPKNIIGLTDAEVLASRNQFGNNEQIQKQQYKWWLALFDLLKEPMLLLLIAVAIIYFILGENSEAFFMLAAIVAVSGISFFQDNRSRKALEALEKLNEPLSTVLRNGLAVAIPTREIVINDLVIAEEGNTINADGEIVHSNDFSVNESTLTGEAYAVFKSEKTDKKTVYSGTLVASGLAVYKTTKIGPETEIGKLGNSIINIKEQPTPLQIQIEKFVKGMAIIGIVIFLLVWGVYFWKTHNLLNSLLKGLTLAMSILPEEIPVAFTTFMALGSWRLMKEGIIVKKIRTVETLGSATVICTDKTGTITQNKMSLQSVYNFETNQLFEQENWHNASAKKVIELAMWASEPIPFDPMEQTLHHEYETTTIDDSRRDYTMVHEYPLDGKPPMMTHVFENKQGQRIIAAKGAPEALLQVSNLNQSEKNTIQQTITTVAAKSYRILAVGYSDFSGSNYPEYQQELPFHFVGLVIFYDPPKVNIQQVIKQFYEAGIQVKVITGDNSATTKAIAQMAGIKNPNFAMEGNEIMQLDEVSRLERIHKSTLMTRMFPAAKLAVVNALKNDNQVVAMIGDGVNDGPALKASHIGIAMGKKGTEIAKTAADLILVDDDLSKMIIAVAAGRRIYTNLKKAVQYIVSIHIPIILTVSLPLFLGWIYPDIFSPVHVIFLELVMGPMCSIVYENEPAEKNSMTQKPRELSTTFLSLKEMGISIIQGIAITAGILIVYQLSVQNGSDEKTTRTLVFTTMVFANIILSLVNRSFYYSVFTSLKNKNNMMIFVNSITLLMLGLILYSSPVATFFEVIPLDIPQLGTCLAVSSVSVLWIELYKWYKRYKNG
ncbi:cation-translocating P-type ATPase [Flavobacterium muglaense]|uniref:Cation-translocating P-type ATPase n=1 Tax=Flavobacterium muglaense TaxID=2764716 RepID=A0A923N1V1_9FLAO|nr:cation-translocating P-type ATPase [Flavobacterium muglaense]MBC5839384.1 cation-translocating P-type ATPase [Flavobacterium muglaense]MBC5845896.1 cation-translocating P-type ATPase [Flavobacterium muglaense]